MTNSKALILLETFDSIELKAFKKYLYQNFKADNLICKIFQYYVQKKDLLSTQPKVFSLPVAHQKVSKKALDLKGRKVFLNALHSLNKALKHFLLCKEMENDSFEKNQLLLKIYRQRKLIKATNQLLQQNVKKIQAHKIKSQWHSLQLFHLAYEHFFHSYQELYSDKSQALQAVMLHLDDFYATLKVMINSEMDNRKGFYPEEYQMPLLPAVKTYLEHRPLPSNIIAHLYLLCSNLTQTKTEASHNALVYFLEVYESQIPIQNQRHALLMQLNYQIYLLKENGGQAPKYLLLLYKKGLAKDFFIFNGEMIYTTYINIANAACLYQEFDWCQQFIVDYKERLPAEFKVASFHLAQATILFAKKEFSKVLIELRQVEFKNISFSLRVKSMILRIYYELDYNQDLILDYCKSFKVFLDGNQHFQAKTLNNYYLLIQYIRIFLRQNTKLSKTVIIARINQENYLQFKPWLLEKANQLT